MPFVLVDVVHQGPGVTLSTLAAARVTKQFISFVVYYSNKENVLTLCKKNVFKTLVHNISCLSLPL